MVLIYYLVALVGTRLALSLYALSKRNLIVNYDPHRHRRQSIRLKDYDYSQPGKYFVNISTRNRECIFGGVRDAEVELSPLGRIATEDWMSMPHHYQHISIDCFRVMPNHLHGIIIIKEYQQDMANHVPTKRGPVTKRVFGKPISDSLSTILGSYKSGVTRRAHELGSVKSGSIWQSRFFDHIIRDDRSLYFIRQYIELNPLFWEFDIDNPLSRGITFERFGELLKQKYGITGQTLTILLTSKRMANIDLT